MWKYIAKQRKGSWQYAIPCIPPPPSPLPSLQSDNIANFKKSTRNAFSSEPNRNVYEQIAYAVDEVTCVMRLPSHIKTLEVSAKVTKWRREIGEGFTEIPSGCVALLAFIAVWKRDKHDKGELGVTNLIQNAKLCWCSHPLLGFTTLQNQKHCSRLMVKSGRLLEVVLFMSICLKGVLECFSLSKLCWVSTHKA